MMGNVASLFGLRTVTFRLAIVNICQLSSDMAIVTGPRVHSLSYACLLCDLGYYILAVR
jgi:hypothetical protein